MSPADTAIDCASDALFGVMNATYDLLDFARHPRSFIPPLTLDELMPPLLEPLLDPAHVKMQRPPGADESWAQSRATIVAQILEEAGGLLDSYFAAHASLGLRVAREPS